MIDLIYFNECVFVYDVEDWYALRKDYRIIGSFFGSTLFIPALPLRLQPEEALLLIEKEIAQLVTYDEKTITHDEQTKLSEYMIEIELKKYKIDRRKQVEFYIDKIMVGKRKKGDMRDPDEIIQEEVNKVQINEKNLLWPIILHRFNKDSRKEIDKNVILKHTSKVKYETYKDLWEKNYYITGGAKFGGAFLVYVGDPILYHSYYIVRCLQPDEKLYPTEVIAMGRVCCNVKKKGLFAKLQNNTISYITINWIDQQ